MDPALPPEFPPQSTTPPLPTSFQNQRPAQHGWNDPPSTVFGAQAAKKRTPRATATSYLNPAHAPLPAHGAAQPYPDAVAQGHAHRGAYIGATNGTPGLQQTLAAPPPPVAAFPPASSPAVQMPAAPPAVSFPSVSPPVAAPPIAMAAPIVPPRIASIAPRSAPADIGGVEAALKKALEESRANNTDVGH